LDYQRWASVSQYRPSDLSSAPSADLAKENERLRLENYILKDAGLDVGERHVGRLMGINRISTVRTRKHKTQIFIELQVF
tara:strand:- start:1182 stop:1421 length:240 start_codon:yes stop_codon:yes gene_type:complete